MIWMDEVKGKISKASLEKNMVEIIWRFVENITEEHICLENDSQFEWSDIGVLEIHLINRSDTMTHMNWVWSSFSFDLIAKVYHKWSLFAADICVLPCPSESDWRSADIIFRIVFAFHSKIFQYILILIRSCLAPVADISYSPHTHNRNEINYAHRLAEIYEWLAWVAFYVKRKNKMYLFCFGCMCAVRPGVSGHTATQYECKRYLRVSRPHEHHSFVWLVFGMQ